MRPSSDDPRFQKISFVIGDADVVAAMPELPALRPFSDEVYAYLNDVSRRLMKDSRAKAYPDVVTLGFWLRRASLDQMRGRFLPDDGEIRLGRGTAFHIAPSNVPVNFAYSLAAGLLAGNANVVRVPSKDFEQVAIVAEALNDALAENACMIGRVVLVRYGRDREVNDLLSSIADARIVWGGDATIAELRKSPLAARAVEVTFADRYSLAVIDAEAYLDESDKASIALGFYNDTYLTDQNACTSPKFIAWLGSRCDEAKTIFWSELRNIVEKRYEFQAIQGVNKLTSAYLICATDLGARVLEHEDNLLVRVAVSQASSRLFDVEVNSGLFFELDCDDVMALRDLCNDKRCQTVGLLGDRGLLEPLLVSGIRGVDRITPIGATMDFDLAWDGYDLISQLSRCISVRWQ